MFYMLAKILKDLSVVFPVYSDFLDDVIYITIIYVLSSIQAISHHVTQMCTKYLRTDYDFIATD